MSKKITHLFFVTTVIVLGIAVTANATIVKVNHSSLLANLTPVPANSREAYSKCTKDNNGSLKVDASIEQINKRISDIIKENSLPYDMGSMNPGNAPKNMPTKEQLKKMTKEEKIAFAMKMQSQMNTNTAPKNTEAWSKCIELNNKFTKVYSEDTINPRLSELKTRYESEHRNIDSETEKAIKTCPVISTGEMSAPDSKCVKAKKLEGAEKHITLAGKELAELKIIISEKITRIKGLIAELDQFMKEVNNGDDLEDNKSKTMLNQAQGLALQEISQIQGLASEAYLKSAAWVVKKQKIAEAE